jgi:hypothetical protein
LPVRVPSSAFPPVAELRFAVPAARRIGIYEDLIGRVEATLRENKGHAGAEAYIATCEVSSWKRSSKLPQTDATRPCSARTEPGGLATGLTGDESSKSATSCSPDGQKQEWLTRSP